MVRRTWMVVLAWIVLFALFAPAGWAYGTRGYRFTPYVGGGIGCGIQASFPTYGSSETQVVAFPWVCNYNVVVAQSEVGMWLYAYSGGTRYCGFYHAGPATWLGAVVNDNLCLGATTGEMYSANGARVGGTWYATPVPIFWPIY